MGCLHVASHVCGPGKEVVSLFLSLSVGPPRSCFFLFSVVARSSQTANDMFRIRLRSIRFPVCLCLDLRPLFVENNDRTNSQSRGLEGRGGGSREAAPSSPAGPTKPSGSLAAGHVPWFSSVKSHAWKITAAEDLGQLNSLDCYWVGSSDFNFLLEIKLGFPY